MHCMSHAESGLTSAAHIACWLTHVQCGLESIYGGSYELPKALHIACSVMG